MTTFLQDEIARVPGESVIPLDWAPVQAANPAWTLTGDVWETVATEDVTVLDWGTPAPITPRMGHVLTVEVQTDQPAEVRWLIHQTYYDGGTLTLADGAANIDPRTPVEADAWVTTARAWDAPEGITSGSFVTEVTAPPGTLIKLRAPFAAPLDGPLVVRQVVAGNPEGARVVLAGDSLTAYDSTGTETARITGEEGVFVGGEFRSSDNNPKGQFIISDDAYVYPADGYTTPGIQFRSSGTQDYVYPPGVGTINGDVRISGGRDAAGNSASVAVSAQSVGLRQSSYSDPGRSSNLNAGIEGAEMRLENVANDEQYWIAANRPLYADGTRVADGWVALRSQESGSTGEFFATRKRASMKFSDGGVERSLIVNETGVWVASETESHNLLPTVTTTPLTMPAGWEPDGANAAKYTITGGACWWSGVIKSTGTVASGWTTLGYAPEDAWPKDGDQLRTLPTTSGRTVVGKVSAADGRIEIWINQSSTGVFMHFSPFTYLV